MDKKKYLPLYESLLKNGMTEPGLCYYFCDAKSLGWRFNSNPLFIIMKPTGKDKCENSMYWGSESKSGDHYQFTPLRQNIVLLMCAMNGEL